MRRLMSLPMVCCFLSSDQLIFCFNLSDQVCYCSAQVSEDEILFLTSLNYFLSLKGIKVADTTPRVFEVRVKAVDTTMLGVMLS
ncbi:putative receptor-like cytosolic serine/threonine-protein kinase RBK1 isoform X1 [Iris pallida]|uniref:Receptor-like cytosolic serine/threonine-protein kinase RBK1 isoform X1 n=1 Tax=Iris pallida TaxID=29817 RepID=A0AAX6FRV8_IRIPA|nr:putative receptor-like cytosolic serine/threonine-protein kinase RBK1 isoform X1 [Iris pallida]